MERQNYFFDAVYLDCRQTKTPYQDYLQIIKDFQINSDNVPSTVLVYKNQYIINIYR